MVKCPNKNTEEYKALKSEFGDDIATVDIINSWQEINNSEEFPTVAQALELKKGRKIYHSLKQKEYKEAIFGNLKRLKYGSRYKDSFFLNNSPQTTNDPNTRVFNEKVLNGNILKTERFLKVNNIPKASYEIIRKNNTAELIIKDNIFTPKDIIEVSKNRVTPRSGHLIAHLNRMFPQIRISLATVAEAKEYYDSLPESQKANIKFDKIKSYFVNGNAVLIKGRTSNETAIEEVLHPFIDALLIDNPELFESLFEESKVNFPVLWQTIQDSYNQKAGFNNKHRRLELVTQALSRTFNKEFENKPKQSYRSLARRMLDWFADIIKDFHNYLTGKNLIIKPSSFTSKTTLTDIATLLNTSDVIFEITNKVDSKVRYSLDPEIQTIVKNALDKAVNPKQEEIIKRLFNLSESSETNFDKLVAGVYNPKADDNLITRNDSDHSYYDVVTGEVYMSATTAIKGGMSALKQQQNKLNLDIGNDFDMLMESIALGKVFNDVKDRLLVLDTELAEKAYNNLFDYIKLITPPDSILLPQVVVYDKNSLIAGTIDLLVVTKEGKLKIIDLKTSKNSIKDEYYDRGWPIKDESLEVVDGKGVVIPGSLLAQKGVKTLSGRQQHNLQVNMYARMLENMGYELTTDDYSRSTFHIKVDVKGKGENQEFLGKFELDGWIPHPPSQNLRKLDVLIPSVESPEAKKIKELDNLSDDSLIDTQQILTPEEALPEEDNTNTEFAIVSGKLEAYKKGLIDKLKAIDTLKSNMYMDRTGKETKEYIYNSIAAIEIALVSEENQKSALFTQLLLDALKQVKDFTKYIEDPKNFNKPEYIGYVLNFNDFVDTFKSLYTVNESDRLNKTQKALVLNLQGNLNKLTTNIDGQGLIDEAIINYVREFVKRRSNRDFTKVDLDDLILHAKDISNVSLMARDMAGSEDVILALMDKIYKNQKQKLLDNLEVKDRMIREKAAKVQRLSPDKNPQKLYHFMIEFDEDGLPTGNYVNRLGKQYWDEETRLRDNLLDENGQFLEYREIKDITNAKQEDIDYNIKLAYLKTEYSNFWRAETKGFDNKPVSGNYHEYTEEFKEERNKYEYYIPIGEHGYWEKRPGVSNKNYRKYKAKYFETVEYTRAIRKDGVPTGAIMYGQTLSVPKRKYRRVKNVSTDGQNLLSEKYRKIMSNADTELGRAQKEFYEMFIDYYDQLLGKIPMGYRYQMTGRIPVMKTKLFETLKKKPNIFTRVWSKMTKGIDDLLTDTTQQKVLLTNQQGNLIDSLPIFYTGKLKDEKEIAAIQSKIDLLNEKRKNDQINTEDYKEQLAVLKAKKNQLNKKTSKEELNLDLGTALIKFNAMAEHYETMQEVENTLKAMVKVLEQREGGQDSNTLKRAKKWMNMVFYDNDQITKGFFDKITDGLIKSSSLSYVAFNPFGNFNNFLLGRLNNDIEMLGGRFFSKKANLRARIEKSKDAVPTMIKRTALSSTMNKVGDVLTMNALNLSSANVYDPKKPLSKFEAFVDYLRMTDDKSAVRESGRQGDEVEKSTFEKFVEFGYILQDAGEYSLQTEIGMSLVIDTQMYNPTTGEDLSLYDAMDFDSVTQTLIMKEGFTQVLKKNGEIVDFNDEFRYNLRNQIREVNKQIHGNYAREDRMVMQSYAVGQLVAQFHKWVMPAIDARFRREYFDENLGWMEGRYRSFYSFLEYAFRQIGKANFEFTKWKEGFLKDNKYTGSDPVMDQKAENKILNTYRTLGEIGIILVTLGSYNLLKEMFGDDDDDTDLERRIENFLIYQANRTYKELTLLIPVAPGSWDQVYKIVESPIASTSTLGNLGEAISLSVWTPLAMLRYSDEEFRSNSKYVYQRGKNRGDLKLNKAWKDVIPILYSMQKWQNFVKQQDFYID